MKQNKNRRGEVLRPASARSLGGENEELQNSQIIAPEDALYSNRFSLDDDDDSILSMPAPGRRAGMDDDIAAALKKLNGKNRLKLEEQRFAHMLKVAQGFGE